MGAWGPGIFSDDTALDIKGGYRELLEDQVPDDEAMRKVVAEYAHLDDELPILWLALAAAQSQLGRLDDQVKARALTVIDTGAGLDLWEEAGSAALAKRQAALRKLRGQLTGPQPTRKAVRRPWRDVTDLQAGDVLSFTSTSSDMALLRVLRIDDHRVGVAPIVQRLDWSGGKMPAAWRLRRLKPAYRPGPGPLGSAARPATYRVSRHRKKDPTYGDLGFTVAARLPPRPEDFAAEAWVYTAWSGLAKSLEAGHL